MKLSAFRGVIESTFTDIMYVKRYIEVENADGSLSTVLHNVTPNKPFPCRISFYYEETTHDDREDRTVLRMTPQLFYKNSEDVKPGDIVSVGREITSGSGVRWYKGKIGLPLAYDTHIQSQFLIDEKA